MSAVARFRNANQTRRTILNLNKRLRFFEDTYLVGQHTNTNVLVVARIDRGL
jgi:hypothetical protein